MSARLQAGILDTPKNNRKPTPRIPIKIDSHLKKRTASITAEKEQTVDHPEIPKLSNIDEKVLSPTSASSGRQNKRRPFTACGGRNFIVRKSLQTPTVSRVRAKSQDLRAASDKTLSPKSWKDAETRQNENSLNKGQSVCSKISEEAHDSQDDKNVESEKIVVDSEPLPQIEKRSSVTNTTNPARKYAAFEEISLLENRNVHSGSEQNVKTEKGNDTDNTTSNVIQKISKIPRAKTAILPVTCEVAKLPVRSKSKNSIDFRSTGCQGKAEHCGESKKGYSKRSGKIIRGENVLKYEASSNVRRIPKLVIDTEKEKTSGIEADEELDVDFTFTSTDESPALVGSAGDPSAMMTFPKLKTACRCRSCSSHNVEKSWSESRSSPELKSVAKKWTKSSKHRKYVNSSSEDLGMSSDSSNESVKRKKRSANQMASNVQIAKKSETENNSTKIRSHRQTRFSFFSALFDIVFWPFIFLRTDH